MFVDDLCEAVCNVLEYGAEMSEDDKKYVEYLINGFIINNSYSLFYIFWFVLSTFVTAWGMTYNARLNKAGFKEGVLPKIEADLDLTRRTTKDEILYFESAQISSRERGQRLLYLFQQDLLPPFSRQIMRVSYY